EQRVPGLLQHPLLVVHDDLGRAEVEQPLEPVVPVDHPAVQFVEVGGGEPAAVQLHHRPQVRWDHRDAVEHHPHRAVAGGQERRDDLQPLEGAGLALALAGADGVPQAARLALQVEAGQPLLDRLRAHAAAEVAAEPVAHLPVEQLVALQVLDLEGAEPVPDLLQPVDLPLGAVTDLAALPVAALAELAPGVALGPGRFQLGEVGLQLGLAGLDVGVAPLLKLPTLDRELCLQRPEVPAVCFLVHVRDHVRGEVDDLLQVLGREVEQVAQPAGHALEVPDVGDRRGQLDVAHPLTPHLGTGDLDAAALADDPLEPDPLVLTAVALPVPGRAEDLLAEQPVLLGLERGVVDSFWLLDLAVRPLPDVVRGRQADTQVVEEVNVKHLYIPWGRSDQTSSTLLGSRRDRSMPSSSAARNTSSSVSRISIAAPSLESTSTFRQRDCISLISTLNDSGIPASGMFSPLTMASYTLTRPRTSSDLIVSSSWSA